MLGLIPKILIDLVEAHGPDGAVARVKELAGLPEDRRYRLDTVYTDAEWQKLLAAACEVLGVTAEQAEVLYADVFARDALRRWPMWFKMSANAREFLERQQTIHNAFATGVRDAEARRGIQDKFRLEKHPNELVVHYRSPNQLCGLYRALARWIVDFYKEEALIEELRCTKNGDDECELHVRWPGASAP